MTQKRLIIGPKVRITQKINHLTKMENPEFGATSFNLE